MAIRGSLKRTQGWRGLALMTGAVLMVLPLEAVLPEPSISTYDQIIQRVARKYSIESDLIHSIIRVESNYNAAAVSPKGAVGLMQLMPETAREYGVNNIYDPGENIEGGVRYLKDLIKAFDGKTDLVLAAYNAGQEAIKKYGGIPPYAETIKYIQKIKQSGYDKKFIRRRTVIYQFTDKSGRRVFTNDHNFYQAGKRKS